MSEFGFYFWEGVNHITDLKGLDHMLFVITLCAVYRAEQWKRILILITAFTIGHSLTLALSALDIIRVNQMLIETLIPVTILLTSIYNIIPKKNDIKRVSFNYFMALGFGLIHGMGFSNFFRAMMSGIDSSFTKPLLAFNMGIETGQSIIVGLFFILLIIFTTRFNVRHREWNLYISGAGGGVAITMIVNALI